MSQDEPPPPPTQPKQEGVIGIMVKDQNGGEVVFKVRTKKVKHNTKLGKVIDKYCEKKNISKDSVRMLFEGERIKEDDTPELLGMQDNDSIDAVIAQIGGSLVTEHA